MPKAITAPTLQQANLKKELKATEKVEGYERGEVFRNLLFFIERKEGKKNLNFLLKKLREMGYEIPDKQEVLKTQWVPEKTIALTGTAAGKIFNWSNKDYFEIGRSMVSLTLISKMYIKYFASISKTLENLQDTYKKYLTRGELEIINVDEKKKEIKCRIKGLDIHPTACVHFTGTISKIIEIATNSKEVEIKETACSFFDNVDYHEYLINW